MSVRFDADGEQYTRSLALGSVTAWTITCWFRIAVDRNSWSTAWSLDNGTSDCDLVQTDSDGTSVEYFSDAGNNPALFTATVGTWYFIGVSRSGTGGTAYHGAAGAALATTSLASSSNGVNAATLRLGASPFTSPSEWLNGNLAAVKMWHGVALGAAEVANEAQQHQPARTENLTAWYPLLSAETVDYSGNARTLSGGSGATTEAGPPIRLGRGVPIVVRPLGGGTPVTVNDRSGALLGVGGAETLVIDRVLADRPGVAQPAGPGQVLTVGVTVADQPGTTQAGRPPLEQVTNTTTLTDRPGTAQLAGPGQALVVDRSLADLPGVAHATGPTGEQATTTTPVIITDRPGVAVLAGTGQGVVADRVLTDRPTHVTAAGPGQLALIDVIRPDRAGAAAAGRPPAEQASNTVTVTDRPEALLGAGPGQVVLVEVIHHDRPGPVSLLGTATRLVLDVSVADRPSPLTAAGPGQLVLALPPNLGVLYAGVPTVLTGVHGGAPTVLTGLHAGTPTVLTGLHAGTPDRV